MENNYLQHYGVIGMKWGVRRYQNYDGTYTKKGLERYYKSKDKYDNAKKQYKTGKSLYKISKKNGYVEADDGKTYTIKKEAVKEAKRKYKDAEKEMKRDYRQLKLDKRADKGKALYSKGDTIANLSAKEFLGTLAISALGTAAIAATWDKTIPTSYGDISVANLAYNAAFIAMGANFIAREVQKGQVRAYYSH